MGGRRFEMENLLTTQLPPAHLITSALVLAFFGDRMLFTRLAERGWDIPGGHVEPGEAPEQAARRELLEETGAVAGNLQLLATQRIGLLDDPPPDWRYPLPHGFQVFYVGSLDAEPAAFQPTSEALEARLFTPADASNLDWVQRNRWLYDVALADNRPSQPESRPT